MPGRYFRKGLIRRSLRSLDRGRIPLPGWLLDCLALWSFATGLLALLLVFRHSAFAPLLLVGSAVPALLGAWIFFVNVADLVKATGEHYAGRRDYIVVPLMGDLRYVKEVVALGRRSIGEAHPDTRTVTRRVGENPSALSVYMRRRSDGKSSLCGYVLLYPLRDEIGEAILSGAMRSEAELGSDPLRSSFIGAKYVYVGMIWGADKHARWHVKDRLRGLMLEVLEAGRIERVFARPGSAFGEAMMKEYGFTPLHDQHGVWSIEGRRLKRRLATEQALTSAMIVGRAGHLSPQLDRDPA